LGDAGPGGGKLADNLGQPDQERIDRTYKGDDAIRYRGAKVFGFLTSSDGVHYHQNVSVVMYEPGLNRIYYYVTYKIKSTCERLEPPEERVRHVQATEGMRRFQSIYSLVSRFPVPEHRVTTSECNELDHIDQQLNAPRASRDTFK
jgi:hypothetical protein